MNRIAAMISAAALVASPAFAGTYSAKPATAPTQARIIGRDVAWNCGANGCQTTTEESRPLVLCQGLAKKAGRIDSFAVDGRAFDAADLAKCNGAAKGRAGELANAR